MTLSVESGYLSTFLYIIILIPEPIKTNCNTLLYTGHCTITLGVNYNYCVGEWGGELRESRLEAWMKSHKSEVAIT